MSTPEADVPLEESAAMTPIPTCSQTVCATTPCPEARETCPETPRSAACEDVNVVALGRSGPAAGALALVRRELVALEDDEVFAPGGGSVSGLVRRALAVVRAGQSPPSELARLEQFALALARAQHELLWQSSLVPLAQFAVVATRAERRFRQLDEVVSQLARRHRLMRGSVPKKASDLLGRCVRALVCVRLLRDHGLDDVRVDLRVVSVLAGRLLRSRPVAPGEVPAIELRDRAYTALCHALARASRARFEGAPEPERGPMRLVATTPAELSETPRVLLESGVFAIAELDPYEDCA